MSTNHALRCKFVVDDELTTSYQNCKLEMRMSYASMTKKQDSVRNITIQYHIFPRPLQRGDLVAQLGRERFGPVNGRSRVQNLAGSRGRVDFSARPIWL